MIFVLILFVSFSGSAGSMVTTHEFDSLQTCEAALGQINVLYSSTQPNPVKGICVQK